MTDYERNADVSKTLTDKWKKGELQRGWYWVEGNRAEGIYAYTAEYLNTIYRPTNGERITEQVPSYDEWQELKEFADYSIHNRDELTRQINFWMQENTKLKEQIQHLSKTQAKQFIDNQKLQTKVKHAKDVINIETERKIVKLKKLLKRAKEILEDEGDYMIIQEINKVLQENE